MLIACKVLNLPMVSKSLLFHEIFFIVFHAQTRMILKNKKISVLLIVYIVLNQGWGTCGPQAKCGPCERFIWPASEFSLPNLN